jgi:hypothetical protein
MPTGSGQAEGGGPLMDRPADILKGVAGTGADAALAASGLPRDTRLARRGASSALDHRKCGRTQIVLNLTVASQNPCANLPPKFCYNGRSLGSAAIPGPSDIDLGGQVLAVVGFEVIEGPFEEEPTEFPHVGVQLGLELVGGLGAQGVPAEADDEAADLDDHREQAHGQGGEGVGERRCPELSGAGSMVHGGDLSWESDRGPTGR